MSDSKFNRSGESTKTTEEGVGSVLLCPEMDRALGQLSSRHRRLILLLLKRGSIETVEEVKAHGDRTAKFELGLVHTHLPKLAESGYVEWDRDAGRISKGPRFEEVEPLLELIEARAEDLPYERATP